MSTSAALATTAALVLVSIPATAPTQVTVNMTSVDAGAREVANVRAEYAAALSAGSAERAAALYADDAIVELGDGTVLRGRAPIDAYFRATCGSALGTAQVTLTQQRFSVGEGVASETGLFSESRSGEKTTTGVYVAVYARGKDGRWRIAMEVRTRGRDRQIVQW